MLPADKTDSPAIYQWKRARSPSRIIDSSHFFNCTLRHSYCTKHLLLYQTQTEALSNEIFQSLDSGDAQIEN